MASPGPQELAYLQERVFERIRSASRLRYPTYKYFYWPYKGLEPIEASELNYICEQMRGLVPNETELLFSFQTDGELIAIPLAMSLAKPVVICRDFRYGREDLMEIVQETGYWTRTLYCSHPSRWKARRICIIDSLVSTGATVLEAISKLQESRAVEIVGVISVAHKREYEGLERIREALPAATVRALWNIDVADSDGEPQRVTPEAPKPHGRAQSTG